MPTVTSLVSPSALLLDDDFDFVVLAAAVFDAELLRDDFFDFVDLAAAVVGVLLLLQAMSSPTSLLSMAMGLFSSSRSWRSDKVLREFFAILSVLAMSVLLVYIRSIGFVDVVCIIIILIASSHTNYGEWMWWFSKRRCKVHGDRGTAYALRMMWWLSKMRCVSE